MHLLTLIFPLLVAIKISSCLFPKIAVSISSLTNDTWDSVRQLVDARILQIKKIYYHKFNQLYFIK